MKKKQIKHFVLNKSDGMGIPVCHCFRWQGIDQIALPEEIAKTKRRVTCKNCRRTHEYLEN